jgi:hypothetical protein
MTRYADMARRVERRIDDVSAVPLEYWIQALTCRLRQEWGWAFRRHTRSAHPYRSRAHVLSIPALSRPKVTAVWLRASAAAKTDEFPNRIHHRRPLAWRTTLIVHRDRTFSPVQKSRRSRSRSPGSCSRCSRPEPGGVAYVGAVRNCSCGSHIDEPVETSMRGGAEGCVDDLPGCDVDGDGGKRRPVPRWARDALRRRAPIRRLRARRWTRSFAGCRAVRSRLATLRNGRQAPGLLAVLEGPGGRPADAERLEVVHRVVDLQSIDRTGKDRVSAHADADAEADDGVRQLGFEDGERAGSDLGTAGRRLDGPVRGVPAAAGAAGVVLFRNVVMETKALVFPSSLGMGPVDVGIGARRSARAVTASRSPSRAWRCSSVRSSCSSIPSMPSLTARSCPAWDCFGK